MFIFSPHQLGISNLCIISLVRNVNIRIDKHEDAQIFQIGSFVCNSLSWKLCKNLCNCSAFLCKKAFSRFSSKLTSKFLWEILIIISQVVLCYVFLRCLLILSPTVTFSAAFCFLLYVKPFLNSPIVIYIATNMNSQTK